MRRALSGLAVAIFWSASLANAAPATDENVVVVQAIEVSVPHQLPANCRVAARVLEVRSGTAYRVGQLVSLDVPCSDARPRVEYADPQASALRMPSAISADPEVLRKHPRAAVHLEASGHLIWKPTRSDYRGLGRVAGFRILEGVNLQAHPT